MNKLFENGIVPIYTGKKVWGGSFTIKIGNKYLNRPTCDGEPWESQPSIMSLTSDYRDACFFSDWCEFEYWIAEMRKYGALTDKFDRLFMILRWNAIGINSLN